MILADNDLCSGCHACYSICPKQCISMKADKEGFLQPFIESNKCINCGRCKDVCPVLSEYTGNPKGKAYVCINKNDVLKRQSSSGGIFSLLAEWVIDRGGVVFGAAFDENLDVKHVAVETKDKLFILRGSKYVQSSIDDSFKQVKSFLEDGKYVLFSGTPCQISGLKLYLGKSYEKLILQDIICHGVPSPKLWQEYLKYQSLAFKSEIDRESLPAFRRKTESWKRYSLFLKFKSNKEYQKTLDKDPYLKAFLNNLCLRKSCYQCHSKALERESDITLADFWGIENILPDMFDNMGTSLVIINTNKGENLFKDIAAYTRYEKVDIDQAVKYNTAAFKSCNMEKNRDDFIKNTTYKNFNRQVLRYTYRSTVIMKKNRFKAKLKGVIKNVFR